MKKDYKKPELLEIKISHIQLLNASSDTEEVVTGKDYQEGQVVLSKQSWGSLWEDAEE